MSQCLAQCTPTCQSAGVAQLRNYIGQILDVTLGIEDSGKLKLAFNTFQCTLPPNIRDQITLLIKQITTETSTLVKDILIFSVLVIFLTLLLLTLFIYLTIYIFTPGAMIGFFILSFIVLIVAVVILYFGVLNIYNNGSTSINTHLIDIENLLLNIECAVNNGLCCLATLTGTPDCSFCVMCQNSFNL